MTERKSLVVIGGGLAGLAAAVGAADAGWSVTLLESRARLGGATHSFGRAFEDGELIVDNGQHVFLRCCTEYRAFLRRLGVEEQTHLQQRLDVPVIDPSSGRRARLRRDRLPAPLHLARALLGYRLLSMAQRLRAIVGALALDRVDRSAPASDEQTFESWLRAHRQSPDAIGRLFDVFTVATLNAPAAQVSLAHEHLEHLPPQLVRRAQLVIARGARAEVRSRRVDHAGSGGVSSRAPPLTSRGTPRSGNGTSIRSKSRGTTVSGKTARASRASSGPK